MNFEETKEYFVVITKTFFDQRGFDTQNLTGISATASKYVPRPNLSHKPVIKLLA